MGRVGVAMPDININTDVPPDSIFTRRIEQKFYELTDHLGNVRATLTDRKLTTTPGSGPYHADIRSYNHPYPFGMPQPGRSWDSVLYRYGFNGMETDPEIKEGRDQHYTTFFRQYDPRLGRWWSHDPVKQMGESPYAAMFNNPVVLSDPFGDDPPGDAKDYEPGTLYPDDKDPDLDWQVLIKESDGSHHWSESTGVLITADGISPFLSRRALSEFTFQDQDANDVRINWVYANPRVGPSASTYHVLESGNSITVIGTYPTIKAADPLLSGGREPKDTDEAIELASYISYQIMTDPNSSPLAKFGASLVDQTVSTVDIIAKGETAAGAPVSDDHRALTAILTAVPALRTLAAVERAGAAAVVASEANGAFYSVAYEMTLPKNLYPRGSYYQHFKVANESLAANMDAAMMQSLNIQFHTNKTGSILWGRSPKDWTWHHDIDAGVLQLVPKVQHTKGSIYWNALHPSGVGGMHLWNK